MRGFIILGALSALSRGAELPVTAAGAKRTSVYKYSSTQSDVKDGDNDVVQTSWTGTCSTGTKQSPIDITTSSAKEESTDPGEIMLAGHDNEMTGKVTTDGRQIYFVPAAGPYPTIYGGPLSSTKTYAFDHLEFKFGTDDTKGSEHKIDGTQYPMEIQLVFWDQSAHADVAAASTSTNADAVVVLSYLVQTDGTTDNSVLADIMTAIEDEATLKPTDNTADGFAVETTGKKLTLKTLLGDIDTVKDYYYYAGSQTSSLCTENVKWIIATDMLKISTTQLDHFQLLNDNFAGTSTGSFVAPNFRDVSGDSIDVMHRSSETKKSETYEDAANILGATLLGIGTFGTVLNLLQQDATAKALKSNPILDLIEDFDKKFLNGEEEQQSHQQFQQQQFQQRY